MTPGEAEASKASAEYHKALALIGIKSIEEAIAFWDDSGSQRWLDDTTEAVMAQRNDARDLTYAWYRLVRALATGSTIALPTEGRPPESVTLSSLREEFDAAIEHVTSRTRAPANDRSTEVSDRVNPDGEAPEAPEATTGDRGIPVEVIPNLREIESTIDLAARKALIEDLADAGPAALKRGSKKEDTSKPAKEVDKKRSTASGKAAVRQASVAQNSAMNGGRSTATNLRKKDKRVVGWVRISKTGSPCDFCAMLMSRGVIYKDEKSAGMMQPNEEDLFHPNCYCVAEPIFAMRQYHEDPKYDLNRELNKAYKSVTKDYTTPAAKRSAWREWVTKRFAEEQKNAQAA